MPTKMENITELQMLNLGCKEILKVCKGYVNSKQ